MLEHRGEIIEKAVRETGFPISQLAKKLGKTRQTLYNLFQNRNVSIDIIQEISKIINHDFSSEIKAFIKPLPEVDEVDYWKNKYLDLLEEHNKLLKKLMK